LPLYGFAPKQWSWPKSRRRCCPTWPTLLWCDPEKQNKNLVIILSKTNISNLIKMNSSFYSK
jgi:hypothetical protein